MSNQTTDGQSLKYYWARSYRDDAFQYQVVREEMDGTALVARNVCMCATAETAESIAACLNGLAGFSGEPRDELQANYLANLTAKAATVALCDELTYCLRELRNVLNSDNLKPFYVRLRTRIDAVLERASGRGHFQTPTEFGSPLTKPGEPS